jgi:hypothetical protein
LKNKAEEREGKNKRETWRSSQYIDSKRKGVWNTADSTGGLLQRIEREVGGNTCTPFNINTPTNRELKENLQNEEIIVHIDFAKIYLYNYTSEIQAVHFGVSHKQVNLQTRVGHTTNYTVSLGSLSSSMRMTPLQSGPISQKHWPTSLSPAHELLLETYFVLN